MKNHTSFIYIGLIIAILTACSTNEPRITKDFNDNWKFYPGDAPEALNPEFNDSTWRVLNLPHDWSIEGSFSKDHPARHEGGALPTGVGWYRKAFRLPANSKDKSVFIEFDGVYRSSEVWVNGHYLGKRPNGYISFRYELTPYLNFGNEENVIAVQVDNSDQPNSRWYTGSGIYRNVRLVTTGKIHVDHWGTFITTPEIIAESAKIAMEITLRNKPGQNEKVKVTTHIYDKTGKKVTSSALADIVLTDSITAIQKAFVIKNPELWSVDRPYMYKAVTIVSNKGRKTDRYETPFGIRYFEFDAEIGFFLNGEPLKILGVCNHHDLGALGAAVNKRAIERQLEILQAMGCNAIRTAHNPPAPELLDLCDRMGFIVMNEAFDVWKKRKVAKDYHLHWDEWHKRDLEDFIRRDRNHPSVFMWSIGNEIREQFDSTGITITRDLVEIVKSLDTTRPVTCALTENIPEKNFIYQSGALDLLGFNYKQEAYEHFPEVYPGEKIIASENMCALATRGYYEMPSDTVQRWPVAHNVPLADPNPDCLVSSYDHISAYWGSTHEETWKVVKNLDFMSGLFVWTGFDYLGEPVPYPFPARSSYFGIIDLAGFPKDAYYMYKSEWTDEPVLHLFPHWNWKPGEIIDIWAYYNQADEVELFLNDNSLGTKKKEEDKFHVLWRVIYEPGTLKAVSRKKGETMLIREIHTAGKPAKIELLADRNVIKADGRDLSFVTVKVLDENGNLVPNAGNMIHFHIEGNGFIAGVDNGYQASHEPFKANYRTAFNGMCLAIIQSNGDTGNIHLEANSEGLESAKIEIKTR